MTLRALIPLYALLLLLAGCTTRIGEPMSAGEGVYTMVGSTFGLMTSTNEVMNGIASRASSFCASSGGKALEVIKVETAAPTLVRFPEGKLQFRCVKQAQDVAATNTESTTVER